MKGSVLSLLKENFLYLVWKSPVSGKQYIIGQLTKSEQYEFQYVQTYLEDAKKDGFKPLVGFPDEKKVYISNILFPSFSSRLPDKQRKDIRKILDKYRLDKFDSYQLLKRSGTKLPIDNLEFIAPY